MNQYDTVIVGAGPAGASAARVLAEGGARVLLIDKAKLPRYKPCGGGLTVRARRRARDGPLRARNARRPRRAGLRDTARGVRAAGAGHDGHA